MLNCSSHITYVVIFFLIYIFINNFHGNFTCGIMWYHVVSCFDELVKYLSGK